MVFGKGEMVAALLEKLPKDINSRAAAERIVNAVIDEIKTNVVEGNSVRFVGLGSFDTVERAERNGRNPLTGESIVIPARRTPKFTASSAFKDAVAERG